VSRVRDLQRTRDELTALWGRKHPAIDVLMGIIQEPNEHGVLREGRYFRCGPMDDMLPSWERASAQARKLSEALKCCQCDMYPADAPPEIADGMRRGRMATSDLIAALDFRIANLRRRIENRTVPNEPKRRGRPKKQYDGKSAIIGVLREALEPFGEKLKLTNCGRFADTYRIVCVALGHKEPQDTIRDFRAYKASL
jgi:hypothetical protein